MSTNGSKMPRSRLSLCLRVLVTISAAVGILANAITILRIKDENYAVWFQPNPQFPSWGRPRIVVHLNSPGYLTIGTWIILAISLAWDLIDLACHRFGGSAIHPCISAIVDSAAFSSFLALLIINGLAMRKFNKFASIVLCLLTYNTFPWIICAGAHLLIALHSVIRIRDIIRTQGVAGVLGSMKLPRLHLTWPDKDGQIRLPADGTGYALLRDENENEHRVDVESNPISA